MLDPTNRYGTKMAFTKLRKFLFGDGYVRIGAELFMRVTQNRKAAQKHLNRLEQYNPGSGIVRVLTLTEEQYSKIWYLTGEPDLQEQLVGNKIHIML